MSILSKIKGSKKAAQQHKQKSIADEDQQKKSEEEVTKVPYKHIPTHAAMDALSGAPSSWKNEDRSKIREHHKRRGQMTISRTHSTLTTISSMSNTIESNSVIPSSLRAISHDSYNPTWNNRVGDISYLTEKLQSRAQQPTKTKPSNHGIDSAIGRSPLSSRGESEATSLATSSRNSTKTSSSSSSSSCDDLEIASSVPRRLQPRHSFRPEPVVFKDHDIFTKLHTSTTRKLGEAPIMSRPQNQLLKPAPVIVAPPKSKKTQRSLIGKHDVSPITN